MSSFEWWLLSCPRKNLRRCLPQCCSMNSAISARHSIPFVTFGMGISCWRKIPSRSKTWAAFIIPTTRGNTSYMVRIWSLHFRMGENIQWNCSITIPVFTLSMHEYCSDQIGGTRCQLSPPFFGRIGAGRWRSLSKSGIRTVKTSLHPKCDEEAVRVILSMPKWHPDTVKGIPVRCYYEVPVIFRQ